MRFAKEYKVYVNGKPAVLEEARVSRMPFNRHWPGRQRSTEQTEVTGFVSFELRESAEIRIECAFPFREAVVRPLSLGIKPVICGGTVSFTLAKPCQAVVEFDGVSGALHLFADPPREAPPLPGENVLYFGKGEHDAGRIVLKSGETVYLDEGAVVYGEIYGEDVENVRIAGRGILDHSKAKCDDVRENGFADPPRPSPVHIEYGKNIEIRDVTVRDSSFLTVWLIGCEDVRVDNVKIIGNWKYNSDGIDLINCRHARIENCFVRSFDDSLCVKGFAYPYVNKMNHGGRRFDIAEDILFRRCTVFNEWGKALEIGIDLCAREIRNCRFEDCDVIYTTGVSLDVTNVDNAYVHDIVFRDIRVEHRDLTPPPMIQRHDGDVYTGSGSDYIPPLIRVKVLFDETYSSRGERGKIRGVTFENVRVTAPRMPDSKFAGFDPAHNVSDIKIIDLYFNQKKLRDPREANFRTEDFADSVTLE